MRLRGLAWQAAAQALAGVEEQAQTLATRAQAALADEHLEGALRSFLLLHELLVPSADRWVAAQQPAAPEADASLVPLSSAAGLCGLWQDLPDLDCGRDSIVEVLLWHAAQAHADDSDHSQHGAAEPPSNSDNSDVIAALALDADTLARQASWLQERLRALPLPRSRYFRRLARAARGGLGDRARVLIQRGALTVLERLPELVGSAAAARYFTTELGRFQHGDRLTLQWQNPLPGQVAILHGVGDEQDAELSVLVPQLDSEAAPRRYHEIVECVGELSHVPGAAHSLIVLWVPELVPPRWVLDVLSRQGLPPDARIWRYVYEVTPAA